MSSRDIHLVRKRPDEITFRVPRSEDAAAVWRLIKSCGSLDKNSLYCNLLQCDHFGETCVAAERATDGAIVGWISGYLMPDDPKTLFVWQVAVDENVQGQGIAKRMLAVLLARKACATVRRLKTTITSENAASWALFRSLARSRGAGFESTPYFCKDAHFGGAHATEHMVTITLAEEALSAA